MRRTRIVHPGRSRRPRPAKVSGIIAGIIVVLAIIIAGTLSLRRTDVAEPHATRPAGTYGPYPVLSVTDGDTIRVSVDGTSTRIRLIGIDTPEVSDPRKPVQCFGREASRRAHELMDGTQVWLEYDPSQW